MTRESVHLAALDSMVAPSIGRALVRGLSAELGFALPMTILVLAMMTVMLTAAFTRVSADRRIADGTEATAWVVPHIIQDPTGVPVLKTFVVRSTGYLIAPTAGPDPLAERTVAQFAVWEPGSIRQLGAVTAFGSDPAVNDHGGVDPFWVFGADDCGEEVAVPGVRTYTTSGLSSTNPDDGPRNNLVAGTRAEIAAETGIDWDAIVNDGALQPDYTSLVPNDTTFKTYFIDAGEVDAENFKGTGLLVITGELDTGNSSSHGYFVWDGIVLLGGALDADAMDSTVINGLLITGLNTLTGESAPTTVFDNNPVHVRYNSCNVSRALERWKGGAALVRSEK